MSQGPGAGRSELYRAETKRVAAAVTCADGTVLSGGLYMHPNTLLPGGFETPLELLNKEEAFYALSLDSGEVALLAKAQTAVVACTREHLPTDEERLTVATEVLLDVVMASGKRYHGSATWELPPDHSRAIDFLNRSSPFLILSDETHTWYINRAHVRAVHPRD